MRYVKHDDLCPCTRFRCDEIHCTCGAAQCDADIAAIVQTFGRRLKEINAARRTSETKP